MASPSPPLLPSLFLFSFFLCFAAASSSSTTPAVRLPLRLITPPPEPGADAPPAHDPAQRLAALVSASLIRARHLKNPKKAKAPPIAASPFPFSRKPLFSHSYGGYSVSLGFGTPAQWIPLLLDTGSDLVWVPCTGSYQCSNCSSSPASVPVFSPKSSSSAKLLGCRNPKCAWMHSPEFLSRCWDCPLNASAAAGCSSVCPPYMVVYGSGSTGGLLISETMDVSAGEDGAVPDFVVGCSLFSSHQPPTGVAGFGRGPASLPAQLGLRRFSYCLISRFYDDKAGAMGTAVLGGAPESYRDGLSFTPFLRNPSVGSPFSVYYYVGLRRITVDGAKVRIPHKALLPLPNGDGGIIIDSGTTFTYMEPAVFEPVARAVAAAATARYNRSAEAELLTGLRPCFSLAGAAPKEEGIALPQLSFHFKDRAEMRLPLANYFAYAGDTGALCMALLTDAGGAGRSGPSIILGSFQQQNYYMVYDLERERLGLRHQSCLEDSG